MPVGAFATKPNKNNILQLQKKEKIFILWRYRYRLYHTDQHRTGTYNYRYSNGQWLGVYWFILGAKWIYIQDR